MAIGAFHTTQEMAEKLLGVKPPWYVERTDFDDEEQVVHVHLAFPRDFIFLA